MLSPWLVRSQVSHVDGYANKEAPLSVLQVPALLKLAPTFVAPCNVVMPGLLEQVCEVK